MVLTFQLSYSMILHGCCKERRRERLVFASCLHMHTYQITVLCMLEFKFEPQTLIDAHKKREAGEEVVHLILSRTATGSSAR